MFFRRVSAATCKKSNITLSRMHGLLRADCHALHETAHNRLVPQQLCCINRPTEKLPKSDNIWHTILKQPSESEGCFDFRIDCGDIMGGRTGRGMARGNAPFLERGCSESAGGVSQKKSRREPYIVRDDLAGDEGFEPPQTESESGVLPLHKSPMWCTQAEQRLLLYAETAECQEEISDFPRNFFFGGPCGRFPNLI